MVDRADLIAALHHTTTMLAGLLELSERLLASLEADPRPTQEQIAQVRGQVERWRQQLETLRQRLGSVTV